MNDKVGIVKTSKSCATCLHPYHTSDICDYRDKDKNICWFDGCKSHHHTCLHGSKDRGECPHDVEGQGVCGGGGLVQQAAICAG